MGAWHIGLHYLRSCKAGCKKSRFTQPSTAPEIWTQPNLPQSYFRNPLAFEGVARAERGFESGTKCKYLWIVLGNKFSPVTQLSHSSNCATLLISSSWYKERGPWGGGCSLHRSHRWFVLLQSHLPPMYVYILFPVTFSYHCSWKEDLCRLFLSILRTECLWDRTEYVIQIELVYNVDWTGSIIKIELGL